MSALDMSKWMESRPDPRSPHYSLTRDEARLIKAALTMGAGCFMSGKPSNLQSILGADELSLDELAIRVTDPPPGDADQTVAVELDDGERAVVMRTIAFVVARMSLQDLEIVSGVRPIEIAVLLGDTKRPALFD